MVGSSFYISISRVPAVQHGGVKFLYQYQSSTSHLAWWGPVFISVSVQHQPCSMVGSSFYISVSPVPAVQHGGVKFLYHYQSSTSRLACWGQVFISVSVQYQPSSMVGSSFYISISPVPAVQHGWAKFLYQYQSSTSRVACWGQVFISVSVQYQPSSMLGSSFYISISTVPAVQHVGVKFLYQYQSSTSRLACWGQVFISLSVQYQPSSMLGSSFYISISPVPAVQHAGFKFLYQCQSSTSRLACWVQVFISVSVQYKLSSMVGSSFHISISRVPAVQHGGVMFLYQYQYSTSRLACWGQVFISVSVQYQPSSMVGSSFYISVSPITAVQHAGVKFLYQYQSSTSRLACWGQVFISVSVQYQPSSMVGSSFYISVSPVPAVQHAGVKFLYQYQYSTSRLAWWGQVFISVSVQYQPCSCWGQVFISVSVQYQPSSMLGSSFYISISLVPAVQHGGVKFLYQCQSSTSRLACWGQVFISVSVQYQLSSMVGSSFYISVSPVPAVQHAGVKFLYQYQYSTSRLAWWGQVFISVSVQYQASSMVGSSFYISVSPVPAVQHAGVKFLYQYQSSTSRLACWGQVFISVSVQYQPSSMVGSSFYISVSPVPAVQHAGVKFLYQCQSSTSRLAWWGQVFISVSVQYQLSSMLGSSFYISVSLVPAVQLAGVKFLYQYQSSTCRLACWGQVFISVSVQYQPSSILGSSFYISISTVPAVQHGGVQFLYQYQSSTSRLAWWGQVFISVSVQYQPSSMVGSSFYISVSPVPAVQHGGVKFLYHYQSSTSRVACWGQAFISVSVQYQSSSMVGSSFYISVSPVPAVQHGGVKFLYQYQYSTSCLAWWGQVFISVSVQYQSSMLGSSFYISVSPVPVVQHGGVKFLYQYQSSTSRLACWGQVFISVSVEYQPSSMVGSSFYISISTVPAVWHGGVKFLYQCQSSTSRLAWWGQVFISVSVQYQPSSMLGSSFYISVSLVPAVQHAGVKFLYHYQPSTSCLAWWGQVFISVSVQYQPSSMVGSSFYISISPVPVPAVQHAGIKFLYQYQSSTSRLAWWSQVFISVSVEYQPSSMVGSSFYISISLVPAVQHAGVKFLYQFQSSTSRLAWWGQVFISVSVQYQYQLSSMLGSSFYISISTVPAVQHGGVKFLYQYLSSTSRLAWWGQVFISVSVQYQPSSMLGSSFYISISTVPAVQHGGVKFLYQYQSSTSRLAWWGQVFKSVSVQYQPSSMLGSSFYISVSPVSAVQHGGVKFLYQYQYSTSCLAWWGQVFISVSVKYQLSSMVGSSFYITLSLVPAVQHAGIKFLYQYQSSTSCLAWWGQVFISVPVQYQPSSMVGQVFISLSVQYQYQLSSMLGSSFYISISTVPAVQHGGVKFLYQYLSSTSLACWGLVFISVSVQYQPSSMVGSSFYISISPVPAVQLAGVKFLYQYQSSTSRLAWWGQVFISVSVQYQPSSMVESSFYISICRVPAVQHGGVKFLYQYQSSTSRLACWGQVFISVSVQYQPSSMVGSSFYISISPVPAVQHGGVKFLNQYQSSTSRLVCWDQVFISVSVQYQPSSMVGSSFYISISTVPAVQHGGVKFLYQYQSSTSCLACWGQVFISVSVQYQSSSMLGSSFYISISPVPAVQHAGVKFLYQYQSSTSRLACWGQVFISVSVQYQSSSMVGSSFYISVSPVPAVQHGGVKFLYQCQSSTSRLAWWGQVFISVSVQYQPSSMVRSSFYISVSPVPVVQHAGVKFLYHSQSSTSRLAWWGQVFISVSVQYQASSMVGSSFYISVSPVPAVQHAGVKFLYQYQSSTSHLAKWGPVFISVSVQYQPCSMLGSSFYISVSPVPVVQHGGVKFLYQCQSSTSRLAWCGQVFISVSVQYQPSSMVGSSFYISISTVPAVQHAGVKFLYQYQSSTSRLACWGQVFISVSVQYQSSSMVGSSFYISVSPVPAVQHGGVKFLYQCQSSTSRLACWGQVFISVSVQYQPSSMLGLSFYISVSPVPAVQHGGVKFLYQCQSSTSRLAWCGQVFISVSVQYQPSSMPGSSFYISVSPVPAVQHGVVKFLYQCQSSTSRLAWQGPVFISVSVQYQPSSMVGSSF